MMTGACGYPRCAYKCKLALRGEGDVVSELFRTQELRRAQADCHDTSVLSAKRPHVIFDICLSGSRQQMLYAFINTEVSLSLHQIPILMILGIKP
jgi:hypothetical protein